MDSEFKQVQSNRTYQELRHHFGYCLIRLKFNQFNQAILKINNNNLITKNVQIKISTNHQPDAGSRISLFSLFKQTISILFILSILFNCCSTSQLTNSNKLKSAPFNNLFFKNLKANHSGNTIVNLTNLPHSISNNDHNFESIDYKLITNLSVLSKRQLVRRDKRSKSDKESINQVFSQLNASSNQIRNEANEIKLRNVNFTKTAFNQSFNLLDLSLIVNRTNQFNNMTTLSPTTLPFISLVDNSTIIDTSNPDQIYIDVLTNTRFWVQRIG